jgi:rhodanese-related sulfurtransferase
MIEKKAVQFTSIVKSGEGIPEVTPEDVMRNGHYCKLIDVRRPDEFTGELGHLDGARLCTLETDLEKELKNLNPDDTHIFICRSGVRSARATMMALQKGLKNSVNMNGGMLAWNEKGYPTTRN